MSTLAAILSSRVKAEIFRLLFGLDEKPLHLREIERRSGLALGTVRQELQTLGSLGLVEARKDGNRTLYNANRQHPIFPDIHSLVLKTSGLADLLRSALVEEPRIKVVFVFGSVARGEEQPHSDIDLMVIGSISLRALTLRLSGLSEKLGRELNAHVFSVDEFLRRKKEEDHFLSTVLAAPRLFILGNDHELATMGE